MEQSIWWKNKLLRFSLLQIWSFLFFFFFLNLPVIVPLNREDRHPSPREFRPSLLTATSPPSHHNALAMDAYRNFHLPEVNKWSVGLMMEDVQGNMTPKTQQIKITGNPSCWCNCRIRFLFHLRRMQNLHRVAQDKLSWFKLKCSQQSSSVKYQNQLCVAKPKYL